MVLLNVSQVRTHGTGLGGLQNFVTGGWRTNRDGLQYAFSKPHEEPRRGINQLVISGRDSEWPCQS